MYTQKKKPLLESQILSYPLSPDKYLNDDQLKKVRVYTKDRADLARMRGGSRAVIDELLIELLVNTGLRASELCDLNIADLPISHGKRQLGLGARGGVAARKVLARTRPRRT